MLSPTKGTVGVTRELRRSTDKGADEDPLLCEYRSNYVAQIDRIDKFMEDVEPLMAYVRAEIKRNDRRAEFYTKVTENFLGAAVFSIFGAIGAWVFIKIKQDFGVK